MMAMNQRRELVMAISSESTKTHHMKLQLVKAPIMILMLKKKKKVERKLKLMQVKFYYQNEFLLCNH